MPRISYAQAIDLALERAMEKDPTVITFGEDVAMLRRNLFVRFGPRRVRNAPISEAAFLGAGVGAAMAGLRPVVEVMLVDFIAVALDALLNEACKVRAFSGGNWEVPLVVRAACGGGYGDGGQHEQCLWGLLSSIPGLKVVVPSNPADAAGLMLSAIECDDPVVFLEHKLLSDYWLDYLGGASRPGSSFDVPVEGAWGEVEDPPAPVPLGKGRVVRAGTDLSILSLGVSVHRALEAAAGLEREGFSAEVIDLRTVCPLDGDLVRESASRTGRVLVVDEDYIGYGLSGEIAALLCEAGVETRFARVCTEGVIPYSRRLEEEALPNADRIRRAATSLLR